MNGRITAISKNGEGVITAKIVFATGVASDLRLDVVEVTQPKHEQRTLVED